MWQHIVAFKHLLATLRLFLRRGFEKYILMWSTLNPQVTVPRDISS